MIPPLKHRQLQAKMKLKALTNKDVAALSGESEWTVCQVLNFRVVNQAKLDKLTSVIDAVPMPKEESAV